MTATRTAVSPTRMVSNHAASKQPASSEQSINAEGGAQVYDNTQASHSGTGDIVIQNFYAGYSAPDSAELITVTDCSPQQQVARILEPGGTYRLHITLPQSTPAGAAGRGQIYQAVDLLAKFYHPDRKEALDGVSIIWDGTIAFTGQAGDAVLRVDFSLPDSLPKGPVALGLLLVRVVSINPRSKEIITDTLEQVISWLDITLNGNYALPTPQELQQYQVQLNQRLPIGGAIMYVRAAQPGAIDITAYTQRARCTFEGKSLDSAPSLASDSPIEDFFNLVYDYSNYGPGDVFAWMRGLQSPEPASASLLICDHSEAPVAWEAINLGETYLGEAISIARWVPIRRGGQPRTLSFASDVRSGRVLALGTLPGQAIERWAVDQAETMDALWARLGATQDRYALVYINMSAPGNGAPSFRRIRPIQGALPLFVLDAPGAGKLIRQGAGVRGLAEPLLGQVADGLIGLAGGLADTSAVLLADLLDTLTNPVTVAEAIRQVRREACKRWPASSDEPSLATAFLLHYHGNPLLRLNLTPAGQEERGAP